MLLFRSKVKTATGSRKRVNKNARPYYQMWFNPFNGLHRDNDQTTTKSTVIQELERSKAKSSKRLKLKHKRMSNPTSRRNLRPQSGYVTYNRNFNNTAQQIDVNPHNKFSSFVETAERNNEQSKYEAVMRANNFSSEIMSVQNAENIESFNKNGEFGDYCNDQYDSVVLHQKVPNLLQKIAYADTKAMIDYSEAQKQYEAGKRQLNRVKKQVMEDMAVHKMHK